MTDSPPPGAATADADPDPVDAGPAPAKHPLRRLVLVAFSVVLFAAIVWFGGVDTWRTVLSGDPWLYFVVFLLTGIAPALSAWRLQTLIHAATGDVVAPWRRFFHINMTAIALGLFLPRNAALLGGKAAYLRTMGVPLLRATWAVLTENVVDLLFLLAIVLPCGLVIVGGVGQRGFLAANAACLATLLLIALWTRGRDWRGFVGALVQRVPFIAARLPMPEGGFVPGAVRAIPMLGMTILIHGSMALRAYVIALAIGLEPSWLVFAAAYPLTQLGLALAVAPGALGTLDASWLGLLILGGLSNEDALSFTVALRACIVVFPVVWYGIAALLSLTLRAGATSDAAPAPAAGSEEGGS